MNIKSIFSSSIGNILEWYDFGLFAVYSTLFSQLFFPEYDTNTAVLSILSVFAVGFICRPIGAIIFGYIGDKHGRSKALRLSILMIALPTFLIGCLPVYTQVGIIAPILLIIVRIIQGISLGGEYSGNLIYLAESASPKYRATITSFAATGANLGILLATSTGTLFSAMPENDFIRWGWRIPYLFSGLLCLLIYLTRLNMQETKIFEYLQKNMPHLPHPLKTVFKHHLPQVFQTLGLICMGSTFYYFCFFYIPVFLNENLHYSLTESASVITICIALMTILVPLAGFLNDYLGRGKLLLLNAILIGLIAIPGFYFLQNNHLPSLLIVLLIFTLASSLEQGCTSVAVIENYPAPARYTGISLSYNIGNGFFGGLVPLISAWLIQTTHFTLAPAFYIVFCAAITGLVVLWLR